MYGNALVDISEEDLRAVRARSRSCNNNSLQFKNVIKNNVWNLLVDISEEDLRAVRAHSHGRKDGL